MKNKYDDAQLNELLYQALETERGGIEIYKTAISCAKNPDLVKEWKEYLEETRTHEKVLTGVFEELGLDTEAKSPGREVVAHLGASLVQAMKIAAGSGDAGAAQLVAAECVVLAETKDHQNWELIGHVAKKATGSVRKVLQQAFEAVNDEIITSTTQGWSRECGSNTWECLPYGRPPEEVKKVETAIGASRAEQARAECLRIGDPGQNRQEDVPAD